MMKRIALALFASVLAVSFAGAAFAADAPADTAAKKEVVKAKKHVKKHKKHVKAVVDSTKAAK
jgi:hypothetical protein